MQEGIAVWRRIADTLRGEIGGGAAAPGARLPTEAQLAARFAVNRHTIRRAMEDLARSGLVRVERGRGAFVSEDVLDYTVAPRTRFSEWIRRNNKEPSGRTLRLAEVQAEPETARALGLRAGARIVLMERLGFADDRPVCLSAHHFPAARLPGLFAALGEVRTITAALRLAGVADYRRKVTRVSARMPGADEARLLRMPRARPLLVCENVNVDREGRVIEFCIARYPTPRVQIVCAP